MKESPGVKKQQLLQTLSHSVGGGGGVPKNVTTNKLAPLILVCMLWDLTVYLKVPSGLNMQFTAIKKKSVDWEDVCQYSTKNNNCPGLKQYILSK